MRMLKKLKEETLVAICVDFGIPTSGNKEKQLGVIESYKDKLYFIEYGRRAAGLPAANDLVIRHCGKRRKVNDLADHNQFPMRLFGNNVDAKRGSWALLKAQPKPTLPAQQPASCGKRKAAR